ncbi:MAG: flavodoxin family protein [Spirochaetaceae bacterium]|jgi:multimeric flavodoxin WrbA|nr:flavodoxin family protein [Spirochaetaceae bacterium]
MKLVIHDLKNIAINNDQNTKIVSDNGTIKPCINCYGCWIRTPGQCVIHDGYDNIGLLFSKCEHLIIASQCFYGGYSPFIQNVFNRSIPYLLPYFEKRNGETHHKKRYGNNIILTAYFYGKISAKEKETAGKLVAANGINLSARKVEIHFLDKPEDLKEII